MLLSGTILGLGMPSQAMAMSEARMRIGTIEVAYRYLATWSSGPLVQGRMPVDYGDRVTSFGRVYSRDALNDERLAAGRRWPVRRYTLRPGTLRVSCNVPALKCAVRSTVDYRLSDPVRHISERGSTRFDLGVGFNGPRPSILYEDGGLGAVGRSAAGR
ncbi:hypothetical protein [Methylobacterium sp. GC_Met_2]|uniref:hypothetical protein n=1 Tax=Methylobacterium sp. GC_Met_2 TaxID=2937376 RepID=UPI00226B3BCB|nr:hypothetical protein [Methylobacterium sp. GC_Met_2]